jgi:stress response protein SCP2
MAIILQKGQSIDLNKDTHDLSAITIGLGWDIKKEKSGGFLSRILGGGKNQNFDMDTIAFVLDENGKVRNMGYDKDLGKGRVVKLYASDVVYFHNLKLMDGTVQHSGDNRTGEGMGDDEQIYVKLSAIHPGYYKILFLVCIYQGIKLGHDFSKIENAFIRAVDAKGKEIVRYKLSGDPRFVGMHSMLFAEVVRDGKGGWQFRAIGEPRESDSFVDILQDYVYDI